MPVCRAQPVSLGVSQPLSCTLLRSLLSLTVAGFGRSPCSCFERLDADSVIGAVASGLHLSQSRSAVSDSLAWHRGIANLSLR